MTGRASFQALAFSVVLGALALTGSQTSSSFAEDAPKFYVDILDPAVPAELIRGDGLVVRKAPSLRPRLPSSLPTNQRRDHLIREAALEPDVGGYDSLDRDRLYMRAKTYEWDLFRSKYPALSEAKLRKFHALVRGEAQ